MHDTFPMTLHGFQKLQKERDHLIHVERPLVSEEIALARGFGDLSENAEYHAAKEKQRQLEDRINYLETRLQHAQVIDPSTLSGPIKFGAVVTLFDEDKQERLMYQIVGADEADLKAGKIALTSALARELIGKEPGVTIELVTPRGERHYVIEAVAYLAGDFVLEDAMGGRL